MADQLMKAYTLHLRGKSDISRFGIRCVVVARSPKEAASILGGDYIEPEGGRKKVSTDPDELHFVGTVSFSPELFRPMDETDRALTGLFGGSGVYNKGPLNLLTNGKAEELLLYEWGVALPDYLYTP